MSKSIVKVFTTLRDHKKKAIFVASALGYLAYYLRNRDKENAIFRAYCEKAKLLGDESLPSFSRPRKVTVLVNEFAKNGKSRYDFEKYALPLLHLAGLEVNVIKTQDAGQLKSIASVLDRQEADAVYVVGGDGTFSIVLNGFMQMLNSSERNSKGLKSVPPPLLAFPGGFENIAAKQILPQVDPNVKWYAENAMTIINGVYTNLGVVEVQIDDNEPFYAAQYLHIGPFQRVEALKWKYWYWGSLKHKFAYVWTSLKSKPSPIEVKLQYVEPCKGCSKCYVAQKDNGSGRSWWRRILGVAPSKPKPGPDYSKIINEKCGTVVESDARTVEILASNEREENFKNFHVHIGPETLDRKNFAQEGLRRQETFKFGLYPTEKFGSTKFSARELTIQPIRPFVEDQEQTSFQISIDGEQREFFNKIKLKVIPDVLQCFVPS